jgi:hypothetical protein
MHDNDSPHSQEGGVTGFVFTKKFEREHARMLLLLEQLATIIPKGLHIMAMDFSALLKAAQDETNAETAVEAVLTSLAQQIKDAAGDQAQITAIAAQLESNASTLAAATVAGTSSGGGTPPTDGGTPINPPPEPSST